jgi:hypothetical protein
MMLDRRNADEESMHGIILLNLYSDDELTGVIKLDASKYLREVIAKFDMVGAHPSPIPAPAGMKIYANESWDGDEK